MMKTIARWIEGISLGARIAALSSFLILLVAVVALVTDGRYKVVVAAAALVSVGLMTWLAQRITAPLRELHQAALHMSRGDLAEGYLDVRATPRSTDEIGQLASVFNQMNQSLREREASLKGLSGLLEQHTAELQQATAGLQVANEQQRGLLEMFHRLSVPAVPTWQGVITLPLIGPIDRERASLITVSLLKGIEAYDARVAILDITGVPEVNEYAVQALLQAASAAQLMGCRPVLTGLIPEFARAMAAQGVDVGRLVTRSDLAGGMAFALSELEDPLRREKRPDGPRYS